MLLHNLHCIHPKFLILLHRANYEWKEHKLVLYKTKDENPRGQHSRMNVSLEKEKI
jgi:hypothetical protein